MILTFKKDNPALILEKNRIIGARVCKHCGDIRASHVEDKCLFVPAKWLGETLIFASSFALRDMHSGCALHVDTAKIREVYYRHNDQPYKHVSALFALE